MRFPALAVLVLVAVGCGGPVDPASEDVVGEITEELGSWVKIGTMPSNFNGTPEGGMTWAHGKLWVGVDDLILEGRPGWYWRTVFNGDYRVLGIGGSSTSVMAGVTYETIRRAPSSGNGWLPVGATLPGPVYDFTKTPSGVVYGDIQGRIARSNDAGATWRMVVGSSYGELWGEGCLIDTPANSGRLYQACKGFWDTWVLSYDISNSTATSLGPPLLAIDASLLPYRNFPTAMASSAASTRTYVGMNGGLIWVDGQDWGFVWDGDQEQEVTAIWADPYNANHLLFGGRHITQNQLILLETWDGGLTVTPKYAPGSLGLENPIARSFTAASNDSSRLALSVDTGNDSYSFRQTVVILVTP